MGFCGEPFFERLPGRHAIHVAALMRAFWLYLKGIDAEQLAGLGGLDVAITKLGVEPLQQLDMLIAQFDVPLLSVLL